MYYPDILINFMFLLSSKRKDLITRQVLVGLGLYKII